MRFVRHWHARAGVLLATFFLFLAVSGLALNHTDALGLAKQHINTHWLMRWYGLKPSVPTRGYLFRDGYLASTEARWVMDGRILVNQSLAEDNQTPVGAITWGAMRAVANADNLFLYLADGRMVDKLSSAALPGSPIKRLGTIGSGSATQLVLQTAQGSFATTDGLTWQTLVFDQQGALDQQGASGQPVWSDEQALPSTLSASLNMAFAPSLPLERIILDLHSGRIFGRYGPLLMDISALGLIILSLSGIWIYLRTARRQSRH
ncbi:MAG: PepSY domain-containing protein [Methylotenera sp.]